MGFFRPHWLAKTPESSLNHPSRLLPESKEGTRCLQRALRYRGLRARHKRAGRCSERISCLILPANKMLLYFERNADT